MKKYLRTAVSLLWGLPTPFILSRKKFIPRALYLVLLRLPIVTGLGELYAVFANVDIDANPDDNVLLAVALGLSSFFIIPYFTIFNCRVRGAGFRLCYSITFAMGCGILFALYKLPTQSDYMEDFLVFAIFFIPYAMLALFKDRELVPTFKNRVTR